MLWLGKWLRRYAMLIIVLAIFGHNLISVLTRGQEPRPQLPPTGYEVEKGTVVLQWNKGTIEEPITLQVAETPDFEEKVFEREAGGVTHTLNIDFIKGQTYYWRLMQGEESSAVSTFRISEYHVKL